jgi:sec-independent protein translocase protein TatC
VAFRDLTPEDKQTILEHLEELRKALIVSVIAIIVAAVASFSFNEQILALVTSPLTNLNENLVVTGVTEAFFVKLKLAFLSGFIIASPIVLWSLWNFFKPALYPSERKYIYVLLPLSLLLFAAGVLFAYFGILQLVLKFFLFIAGESLETMFKVDQYVAFVLAFTIPFGLVFELPIVIYFLTIIGVVRYEVLARNRKYALLIIVILAAALTPGPDPISQLMMAGPVYLLFEISIWISKWAGRKKRKAEEASENLDEQ